MRSRLDLDSVELQLYCCGSPAPSHTDILESTGRVPAEISFRAGSFRLLEIRFRRTAHGALPVIRKAFKGGAGWYVTIRVTEFRVVDPAAYRALVFRQFYSSSFNRPGTSEQGPRSKGGPLSESQDRVYIPAICRDVQPVNSGLEILSQHLVESLRMLASGAFFRRLSAFKHVTAVGAMPLHRGGFLEDLARRHVAGQLSVTGLMEFLDFGNLLEGSCNLREPLFAGSLREVRVDGRPLHVLARSGRVKI